jgi:hypothetical protein
MQEQIHNEVPQQPPGHSLTLQEKNIYNTFLRVSRSQSGLPFRYRKEWEGFEKTEAYVYVLRLKNFFNRNNLVSISEFFLAPYIVYPGENGFDLQFYASQKAIKVYAMAMKKKLLLPPDDKYQLDLIMQGLKFIRKYCKEQKIPIHDYIDYKLGVQHEFIGHLKTRQISIYNLFAFANFENVFRLHDPDLLRFTLGEIYDQLSVFRTKYLGSKKAKILATHGLKRIDK